MEVTTPSSAVNTMDYIANDALALGAAGRGFLFQNTVRNAVRVYCNEQQRQVNTRSSRNIHRSVRA
jgi:hypothetical protein